jgi:hypothetical protein
MEARVGIQSATHVPNFLAFGVCGQQRYPVWYPAARADFLVRPWTSLRVRRTICTYSSPLHMMNTICVYGRATLFTDAFTNDLLMRLCQPGPLTPKNQRTSGQDGRTLSLYSRLILASRFIAAQEPRGAAGSRTSTRSPQHGGVLLWTIYYYSELNLAGTAYAG